MLKRIFLSAAIPSFFLAGGMVPTSASAQQVSQSQIKPALGFIRKGPCGVSELNCGSNPPTYQITPAGCGIMYSTSNARNTDGSISTKGVRFILPSNAELLAAGYAPSGTTVGDETFPNREGQCQISFVMGSPRPENYLRLAISGVQSADRFTSFEPASYDIYDGELTFPFLAGANITVTWNGTSWIATSGTPLMMERLGKGQVTGHGQGRFFKVTAQPSWWTAGSIVGRLAYCPVNGQGLGIYSDSHVQLAQQPTHCAFSSDVGGTTTSFWGYRSGHGLSITSIAAGDAYASGVSPDGTSYPAGNYVRLTTNSTFLPPSGTTVEVYNVPTNLGTNINGRWLVKVISSTVIELHQKVEQQGGPSTVANIGAPSSFVAGDTMRDASYPALSYRWLTNLNTTRYTSSVSGIDFSPSGATPISIVGMARRVSGVHEDTPTNRLVASAHNAVDKICRGTTAADRTTAGSVFNSVNTDIRCNFIQLSQSSKKALDLGDVGQGVPYSATIAASNSLAGAGCEFAVAFDGTTPESEVAAFTNPTGVSGGKQMLTINGVKTGLTEDDHYINLVWRAVGGGTCTLYSANTAISASVRQ